MTDLYNSIAGVVNTKATRNQFTFNPPSDSPTNTSFNIGDLWVNTASNMAWIMTSRSTNTAVTWTLIT